MQTNRLNLLNIVLNLLVKMMHMYPEIVRNYNMTAGENAKRE
ncbi:protein of unknown function [Pseudodesulfovibrio profundus]|uniref:Uncharacterized protein n=1 Tax=Pseudodesulfovibrio profundus TaxID=57320 RepID=A0A2C8F9I5_9BACT|nr:protein of unknown function [Pseudodesulfovibrio profundus]